MSSGTTIVADKVSRHPFPIPTVVALLSDHLIPLLSNPTTKTAFKILMPCDSSDDFRIKLQLRSRNPFLSTINYVN
jgi:hypothetical protein